MNRRLIAAIFGLSLVSAQALAQEEEGTASVEASAGTSEAPSAETGSGRPGAIRDLSVHKRPLGGSLMAYIPWYYGFGIGVNARVEIPIVHDGFIPAINDQVSIEPSLGFAYRNYDIGGFYNDDLTYLDITPAVYGMWSFHITPKFRPYAALGLGYNVAIWLNEDDITGTGGDTSGSYFYWDVVAGLFYSFTESFAFRGELGAQGPKAGISLFF